MGSSATFGGYGMELFGWRDFRRGKPVGSLAYLWDEKSMQEKGGGGA